MKYLKKCKKGVLFFSHILRALETQVCGHIYMYIKYAMVFVTILAFLKIWLTTVTWESKTLFTPMSDIILNQILTLWGIVMCSYVFLSEVLYFLWLVQYCSTG